MGKAHTMRHFKRLREVIFIYSAIDEFTLQHLDSYENRKIISIEKSDIDLGEKKDSDGDSKDDQKDNEEKSTKSKDGSSMRLSENEITEFCSWFKSLFPDKVKNVKATNRLSNSPAMITNHDSGP